MRKTQIKIKEDKTYGQIYVLSSFEENGQKKYNCKCGLCGQNFIYNGQYILTYQNDGCPNCRTKEKDRAWIEKSKKYIGYKSGQLKIIEIVGIKEYCGRRWIFAKCLCECGNTIEIPLNRIIYNQSETCGHNRKKQLDLGTDILKDLRIDNTLIVAIDDRRKKNKNNTSGFKGISYYSDTKKYRAYITFKGKQYHLGLYDNIDDACAARKEAEEKIYGDFLTWYAKKYPEKWEKIKRKNVKG